MTSTLLMNVADLDAVLGERWDEDLVERGLDPVGLLCDDLRLELERLGHGLDDHEVDRLAAVASVIVGHVVSSGETSIGWARGFMATLLHGMALGVRIERAQHIRDHDSEEA